MKAAPSTLEGGTVGSVRQKKLPAALLQGGGSVRQSEQ